jgi:hypothetical protein
MLFPQTDRTTMDLVLTRGESAFDPLNEKRFETESMGLVSDMERVEKKYIIVNLIALGIFTLMVVRK